MSTVDRHFVVRASLGFRVFRVRSPRRRLPAVQLQQAPRFLPLSRLQSVERSVQVTRPHLKPQSLKVEELPRALRSSRVRMLLKAVRSLVGNSKVLVQLLVKERAQGKATGRLPLLLASLSVEPLLVVIRQPLRPSRHPRRAVPSHQEMGRLPELPLHPAKGLPVALPLSPELRRLRVVGLPVARLLGRALRSVPAARVPLPLTTSSLRKMALAGSRSKKTAARFFSRSWSVTRYEHGSTLLQVVQLPVVTHQALRPSKRQYRAARLLRATPLSHERTSFKAAALLAGSSKVLRQLSDKEQDQVRATARRLPSSDSLSAVRLPAVTLRQLRPSRLRSPVVRLLRATARLRELFSLKAVLSPVASALSHERHSQPEARRQVATLSLLSRLTRLAVPSLVARHLERLPVTVRVAELAKALAHPLHESCSRLVAQLVEATLPVNRPPIRRRRGGAERSLRATRSRPLHSSHKAKPSQQVTRSVLLRQQGKVEELEKATARAPQLFRSPKAVQLQAASLPPSRSKRLPAVVESLLVVSHSAYLFPHHQGRELAQATPQRPQSSRCLLVEPSPAATRSSSQTQGSSRRSLPVTSTTATTATSTTALTGRSL